MKNLTKQWREGKLPLGAYYVIYQYNERMWLYRDKSQTPDNSPDIYKIITRVPPYELWEKTKQENKILKKAQYLTFGAAYTDTIRTKEENTRLRKLLNECHSKISRNLVENEELSVGETIELITKLENILGDNNEASAYI